MQPYKLSLPEKRLAHVINKRLGIRRPSKLLFFKYKNRQKIIAYTVIIEGPAGKNEFEVFKTQEKGAWLKGAKKNGVSVARENEKMVSRSLKSAIDEFESQQGILAFQELF